MIQNSVSEVLCRLELRLREKLDPLGFVNGEAGAFKTGHAPHKFPQFYLFCRYAGLNEEGIVTAEQECERYIPDPYKELLRHMNGAKVLGVSLRGAVGNQVDRSGEGIGQPISLRYENVDERPSYIPEGHLCIGGINGDYYSSGRLYLTSTGELELYNRRFDLIGAKWSSLTDFLSDEIPRRLNLYDETGLKRPGGKQLPGDTDNWERLAQEANQQKQAAKSLIGRIKGKLLGS